MLPLAPTRATAHPIPFTPWSDFFASWVWRQGEHVTIIGPTGTGKTTVMRALMRKHYDAGGAVAVLATKPKDASLESWARRDGLRIVRHWPPESPWYRREPADVQTPVGPVPWWSRVMLWPQPDQGMLSSIDDDMTREHKAAMQDMFWGGRWTIAAEELWELTRMGLGRDLQQLWSQGRSSGISVIGGTQRPVDIPLLAYSSASHLFMFGDNDEVNLRRLQGIGGMSSGVLREAVAALRGFDVLYIGTRTRELIRTRVPVRKEAP
jgi:energy-coupling factor transporter ATP-binding protein EcfA2